MLPLRPPSRCGLIRLLGHPSASSKLGQRFAWAMLLICGRKLDWVPNGPSEQPQRKGPVREGFRACPPSARCTAVRQKRRNSWAFSADRRAERVSVQAMLAEGSSLAPNILFARLRALPRYAVHIIVRGLNLCRCRWLTAHPSLRLLRFDFRLAVRRHDPRWQPGAVVPLAGICAGGGEQSPSLPRQLVLQRLIPTLRYFDSPEL